MNKEFKYVTSKNIRKIIKHYGIFKQIKKLSEEVCELQTAIIEKTHDTASIDNITEELADVILILGQFIEFYNIYNSKIEEVMNYKILRTLKNIENEKDEIKNTSNLQ